MRKVERNEIVDFATYGDQRDAARAAILETKRVRRVHVGEHLTFLFENADTIRYQIQEIMRAERIVREADVMNEITTYNRMLGDDGELGCCLLIEIDDKAARDVLLREWHDLPAHLYVRCLDANNQPHKVAARFDPAQANEEKISSVQYLRFAVGALRPVAIGTDLPALVLETPLSDEQQKALMADLAS